MTNWLTNGRTALLAALQADATLSGMVAHWYAWGTGLLERFEYRPADCPLISVIPAALDEDELANASSDFPQDLDIICATDGQDAEACEEIVAAAVDVIDAARQNCLGLAADGLANVTLQSIQWVPWRHEDSPRVLWTARLTVRLLWKRLTI